MLVLLADWHMGYHDGSPLPMKKTVRQATGAIF